MNELPVKAAPLTPEVLAAPPPGPLPAPFMPHAGMLAVLDGGLPRSAIAHKAFARSAKVLNTSATALAQAANEVRNNEQRQSLVAAALGLNVVAGLCKTGADMTKT